MTLTRETYVLARGISDRPVCQHKCVTGTTQPSCGVDVSNWSCQYTNQRFDVILCRRAACRA